MTDIFSGSPDSVVAPATDGAAVAPSDTSALPTIPKALYVGGGGDLAARGLNGSADITFKGVPAGAILPFRARFVRATGTTATSILALF